MTHPFVLAFKLRHPHVYLICCIALGLMAIPLTPFAQRFGGTPPSVKWKQVNTDTVRVIFPAGLDSQARRVATLVHAQAARPQSPLGNRLRKIDIVLQNQTTIANGYVGLGPYRSEFYLTPSTDNFSLGSIDWVDQLATHEYRHVEQYNNFEVGISRLMRVLFGQEGYAVASGAAVPDWFFEGDAVYNETVVSRQGRGRLPSFMNAYPSLWLAGKDYSWMKLRNGSLKDYVPGHYNLGFLLVNYGYGKYGEDFWRKVTRDAAAFKGLFYPFQKAIERHAGVSYQQFRRDALRSYKEDFSRGLQPVLVDSVAPEAGPSAVLNLNKRVLHNYYFPQPVDSGSFIYQQISNQRRPAFFIHDSTGEHWVRNRDISTDEQFSYRNGRVVYAAYRNDPRWRWRDYSVLKLVELDGRRSKTITSRSRYFTPDINEAGDRVIAVQVALNGESSLHLLDHRGKLIRSIGSSEITLFTNPKFYNNDSVITSVRFRDGRMALAMADLTTGSISRITDPTFNVIGYPWVDRGIIYFTSSYNNADQVFAIRPGSRKVYQVTDWPLGSYYASVQDGRMRWSVATADGLQMQEARVDQMYWKEVATASMELLAPPFPVNRVSRVPLLLTDSSGVLPFPVSNYAKSTRLFNFHSWRPYYEDPEFRFSLYGENVLNTLQSELYYLYNENDRTHAAGFNMVYGGLYPYITAGGQYTFDRTVTLSPGSAQARTISWNQLDTRVGVSVPWSWTSGQTMKALTLGTDYAYRQDHFTGRYKDSLGSRSFGYLRHYISFTQQVQMARQHIFPRLGYSLNADYRHVISNLTSWQYLLNGTLYLPGFLSAHSLVLRAGLQEVDTLNTVFGNNLAYARGYNAAYFSRMWRASVNYHLPLLYPDWGFANILYINRVRANLFFDITRVFSTNKLASADQRSTGAELFFDTKWWNQYELTFGLRYSYLLDRDFYTGRSRTGVFEFVLPVSIFPK